MKVIVDTSVWSEVLRRKSHPNEEIRRELEELIREGRVVMLGPVRQELLSGIRLAKHFTRLREGLRPFDDYRLSHEDFEEAAACFNKCRAKGVQGSNTDLLISAVALRHDFEIFTTDRDFLNFQPVLKIRLYESRFVQ
ncbi:PIN domain-containing protein [Myxococcota bacterium]|nr:PIN domain-containing protein [Myxococcota bacterium]